MPVYVQQYEAQEIQAHVLKRLWLSFLQKSLWRLRFNVLFCRKKAKRETIWSKIFWRWERHRGTERIHISGIFNPHFFPRQWHFALSPAERHAGRSFLKNLPWHLFLFLRLTGVPNASSPATKCSGACLKVMSRGWGEETINAQRLLIGNPESHHVSPFCSRSRQVWGKKTKWKWAVCSQHESFLNSLFDRGLQSPNMRVILCFFPPKKKWKAPIGNAGGANFIPFQLRSSLNPRQKKIRGLAYQQLIPYQKRGLLEFGRQPLANTVKYKTRE